MAISMDYSKIASLTLAMTDNYDKITSSFHSLGLFTTQKLSIPFQFAIRKFSLQKFFQTYGLGSLTLTRRPSENPLLVMTIVASLRGRKPEAISMNCL